MNDDELIELAERVLGYQRIEGRKIFEFDPESEITRGEMVGLLRSAISPAALSASQPSVAEPLSIEQADALMRACELQAIKNKDFRRAQEQEMPLNELKPYEQTLKLVRLTEAAAASQPPVAQELAYLRHKLRMALDLLQEARDALPAISLASAKLHRVRLDLGDRMDKAGTFTRADFDVLPADPPLQVKYERSLCITDPPDGPQATSL